MDISQFALVVMKNVREFVQPALDAMSKRIDEREAALRADFDEKVAAIPAGKDGAPGTSGERGEKGDAGLPGKDGAPAADIFDVVEMKESIKALGDNSFDADEFCAELEKASGS